MDMNVKWNLSYPALAHLSPTAPADLTDKSKPKVEAITRPAAEPKRDELEQAVSDISKFVQASQRKTDFSIDDSSGRVVVKVIATESGKVIR